MRDLPQEEGDGSSGRTQAASSGDGPIGRYPGKCLSSIGKVGPAPNPLQEETKKRCGNARHVTRQIDTATRQRLSMSLAGTHNEGVHRCQWGKAALLVRSKCLGVKGSESWFESPSCDSLQDGGTRNMWKAPPTSDGDERAWQLGKRRSG